MIKVEHISKTFGSICAISDISFEAAKGEVLGFLGPNGAGKTTTMRILTGFLTPSGGRVFINGADIEKDPLSAKGRTGYLSEGNPLYPFMTPLSFLRFVAGAKGIPRSKRKEEIESVLERCNLNEVSGRRIGKLSKGYRQRVGLAQALLGGPDVVILDEPTSGLDPQQIIEIRHLIKGLKGKQTVIVSTHILSEVSQLSDRIVIINNGRLVASGGTHDLARGLKPYEEYELTVWGSRDMLDFALKGIGGFVNHDIRPNTDGTFHVVVRFEKGEDRRSRVTEALYRLGLKLLEFRGSRLSLEDVYLRLLSSQEFTEAE
ncbi:MAG: ABC transporter ATP-binding protein [Candidatus Omnitrophica bacterium]|nr:ABC transporter ATP-binding protein [Candidatus Omnitrophota bacterium]